MIVAILDRVRSMYNVGSFFRTCDGAGIDKLYLTGYTPTPPRTTVTKTALGAEQSVPWEWRENTTELITELKSKGMKIIAVECSPRARDYRLLKPQDNTAYLFGNEVEGVHPDLLALSDEEVVIPMRGKKHSLNVATAAGVILYHGTSHL